MGFITWLLVGLIAGTLAKMITPQDEKGGWVSSLVVGIIGSFVGGFLAGLIGISSYRFIGEIIIAFAGAILVLFIYHKYLAEKFGNVI
jgi:uncharacterized membrane protein YeaQ/YmgE (transglycosylase-associated protein family)